MPQGVIPCLERHRDTTQPADFRRGSKSHSFPSRTGEREWLELNALLAAALPFAVVAVPGSVRPGSTFLLGVSCLARGLIACCAAGLQGLTLAVGSALGKTWLASRLSPILDS